MSDWVACPSCNLQHRARAEGTCPRCNASVSGAGVAAPLAYRPGAYSPAPYAAPVDGTFIGGFLGGFLFGLVGLIACFLLGKPATKSGAGYGFLGRIGFAVFAVIVFAVFGDGGSGTSIGGAVGWTTHRSPYGYSADLPREPKPNNEVINSKTFGKFPVFAMEATDLRAGYESAVGHFDMPDGFTFIPSEVFDDLAVGFVTGGKIVTREQTPLGRNPGGRYVVEATKGSGWCGLRMVAVNRRIIFAQGCAPKRDAEVVTRVPASLKLGN